jgi:hypothetical protein
MASSSNTKTQTGKDGYCPDGSSFSFDPVSKEGKCCHEGSKFSWDAAAQKGDCHGGLRGVECEYQCSCQARPKAPSCESKIFAC